MNVYLVRHEEEFDGNRASLIVGAFATREAAETYIESINWTFERCLDEERCDYDDAWETVTRHPMCVRGVWIVDGDEDSPIWFVDKMDVWGLVDSPDEGHLRDTEKMVDREALLGLSEEMRSHADAAASADGHPYVNAGELWSYADRIREACGVVGE